MHPCIVLPLTSLPFPLDSRFLTFRRKPVGEEDDGKMEEHSVLVPGEDRGAESSVVLLEVPKRGAWPGSSVWPLADEEMDTGRDRLSCSDLLRCGRP